MKKKLGLYLKAAQSAKIGIWEINLKTNEVYWDSVTKLIHEVDNDFIPTIATAINFYLEGDNKNKISLLLEKAVVSGISFNEIFQIVTAKNRHIYAECICQIELEFGKPIRIIGTFQDITKEQNLIKDLKLNVEKFSSIFSSANDAIFIIDSINGIISDCNSRSSELAGYELKELIGKHYTAFFPKENQSGVQKFIEKHLTKDDYIVNETFIISKKGEYIPVEVASGKKFQVNHHDYLVCFIRDISERKNIEKRMNLLSLAASKISDTIIISDSNGLIVWANDAFLKLTCYTMGEVVGKKPGTLVKGSETDPKTSAMLKKAIQNKESIEVTILNYTKHKEKYWFELNINPIYDNNLNLVNFIGVGRNITVRKEKEFEMMLLLDVTSLQNNKLFNFAHIVSHNIRSHTSNLSMILDVVDNTDNDLEKLSFFDLFKEGIEKLSETIEDLNEIITIQKKTNIEKKKIFLNTEIEKTKSVLSLIIKESNISIINTVPENLTVFAIPVYLESIVLNLMTNAIKYKSNNKPSYLTISCEKSDECAIICFKDNGLGIDLEKNGHKIFGMYKTFHGNEDAKGIGLFITKNQVEAMNGKIEVESKVGIGTEFKIYLNEK